MARPRIESALPGIPLPDFHKVKRRFRDLGTIIGTAHELYEGGHVLPKYDAPDFSHEADAASLLLKAREELDTIRLTRTATEQSNRWRARRNALYATLSGATTGVSSIFLHGLIANGVVEVAQPLVMSAKEAATEAAGQTIGQIAGAVATEVPAVVGTAGSTGFGGIVSTTKLAMRGLRFGQIAELAKQERIFAEAQVAQKVRGELTKRADTFVGHIIDLAGQANPDIRAQLQTVWNSDLVNSYHSNRKLIEIGELQEAAKKNGRKQDEVTARIEDWLTDDIRDSISKRQLFDLLLLTNTEQATRVKSWNKNEVLRETREIVTQVFESQTMPRAASELYLDIKDALDIMVTKRPVVNARKRRPQKIEQLVESMINFLGQDEVLQRLTPRQLEHMLQVACNLHQPSRELLGQVLSPRLNQGEPQMARTNYDELLARFNAATENVLDIDPTVLKRVQALEAAALDLVEPKETLFNTGIKLSWAPKWVQRWELLRNRGVFWDAVEKVVGTIPDEVKQNEVLIDEAKKLQAGSTIAETFHEGEFFLVKAWNKVFRGKSRKPSREVTPQDPLTQGEHVVSQVETEVEQVLSEVKKNKGLLERLGFKKLFPWF